MTQLMRRPPAVAGRFYSDDADQLGTSIRDMLASVSAKPERALGAIVPHAGHMYSGLCAAEVWARVRIPPTVVIIAPNHTGRSRNPGGASAWTHGVFQTPLGDVPIAEEFALCLERRCELVGHDRDAHLREHAIEVELPFLQVLAPDAAIVPLVLAWDEWELCEVLASDLAETVRSWDGDVLVVASSDMTHYETAVAAAQKDRVALAAVERLDGEELLEVCHRDRVTMCGRAPSAVTIETARLLGATGARVVDYRHSGWVTGDDTEVVAYAGVVIS